MVTTEQPNQGVPNFMRSIAPVLKRTDGSRACAILPRIVKTPLMGLEKWETYPQHFVHAH